MEKTELKPCNIVGIAIKTSNVNQQSSGDIARLWEKFWSENIASQIPNKVNDTIYCVYTEYEGDFTQPYTTVIGYATDNLNEIPEGMKGIRIEGGMFVKLTAKGKLSDGIVVQEWSKIWQSDLHRTYQADFEVYSPQSVSPDYAEIDIFAGIQ
ncbi:MAG: effector binding domain-containing protein [Bacteroides sp.]|nr:effector binding domain-containing protein [Bacteroides sp.]